MRRVSRMVALGRCLTAGTAAVTLAAALCAVASASVAAPAGVVAGSDSGGTPVGAPPAMPIGAHDRGLAASAESVAFDVVLAPRNQAAVDAFVAAVSTPGSPSYQQFLAPGEFATRFGPTPATIARVTDGLRALGLTVGEPRGSVVPVSGTVSTITAALHTSFRHYALASGRVVRANDAAPRLPTAFAAAVQGIVGLDDLAQFRHPAPPIAPDLTAASGTDPTVDPAVDPASSRPSSPTSPARARAAPRPPDQVRRSSPPRNSRRTTGSPRPTPRAPAVPASASRSLNSSRSWPATSPPTRRATAFRQPSRRPTSTAAPAWALAAPKPHSTSKTSSGLRPTPACTCIRVRPMRTERTSSTCTTRSRSMTPLRW